MIVHEENAGAPSPLTSAASPVTRYAWVILLVVFLASVAAPLNQFKVPPLVPVLMESLRLNLSQAGLLMSVSALTGLILALPAGLILQRLGPKAAGLIASLSTLVALGSAPLSGWLSDRTGSRRLVIAIPFLIIAGIMLLPFQVTGWPLYALMLLIGLVSAAPPTISFAAAPEVMGNPRLAGIGLGVVSIGMNLGMVIGPILFGILVEAMGWTTAGYWMIPVCILGFVAAWMVKLR